MQHLLTLAALGFAAYRATQLVVWDSILDSTRKRIELWRVSKFDSRFRKFIWDLITCPYCTGWWVSMITTLVYLTAAGQWGRASLIVHAVECWAVAGIQALLNRWDDSRPGHEPKGH
jgi:uncharacterized membrane protein